MKKLMSIFIFAIFSIIIFAEDGDDFVSVYNSTVSYPEVIEVVEKVDKSPDIQIVELDEQNTTNEPTLDIEEEVIEESDTTLEEETAVEIEEVAEENDTILEEEAVEEEEIIVDEVNIEEEVQIQEIDIIDYATDIDTTVIEKEVKKLSSKMKGKDSSFYSAFGSNYLETKIAQHHNFSASKNPIAIYPLYKAGVVLTKYQRMQVEYLSSIFNHEMDNLIMKYNANEGTKKDEIFSEMKNMRNSFKLDILSILTKAQIKVYNDYLVEKINKQNK